MRAGCWQLDGRIAENMVIYSLNNCHEPRQFLGFISNGKKLGAGGKFEKYFMFEFIVTALGTNFPIFPTYVHVEFPSLCSAWCAEIV